jgi:hypothetical protein
VRLRRHLTNNNFLNDYIMVCESLNINEMSSDTFRKIEAIGKKLGFKVKKSKTLMDYLRSAGKGVEDLLRYATLYMMTDVTDSKSRKELVRDAKATLKSVNKKDVAAMLIMLDKVSLGLTSHVRHVFQTVFGVELSTVNYWMDDVEYIEKELKDIRVVLNRMEGMEKEIAALDKFEASLKDTFDLVRRVKK